MVLGPRYSLGLAQMGRVRLTAQGKGLGKQEISMKMGPGKERAICYSPSTSPEGTNACLEKGTLLASWLG